MNRTIIDEARELGDRLALYAAEYRRSLTGEPRQTDLDLDREGLRLRRDLDDFIRRLRGE